MGWVNKRDKELGVITGMREMVRSYGMNCGCQL